MKKSFSLLEVLVVLVILSIIVYTVIQLTYIISYTNKQNHRDTLLKIELESTRLFIKNHLDTYNLLSFKEDKLLYKDNLLLERVESFDIKMYNTYLSYTICIKKEELFCQEYILSHPIRDSLTKR